MNSAQVSETLVTTTVDSPSQNYNIVITRVNQQYLHLKESERDSFAKRDMVANAPRRTLGVLFARPTRGVPRASQHLIFWLIFETRATDIAEKGELVEINKDEA